MKVYFKMIQFAAESYFRKQIPSLSCEHMSLKKVS